MLGIRTSPESKLTGFLILQHNIFDKNQQKRASGQLITPRPKFTPTVFCATDPTIVDRLLVKLQPQPTAIRVSEYNAGGTQKTKLKMIQEKIDTCIYVNITY